MRLYGFFGSQMYDKFDGVLAMYHDQGLAPFKTLAMDDGVNYTGRIADRADFSGTRNSL